MSESSEDRSRSDMRAIVRAVLEQQRGGVGTTHRGLTNRGFIVGLGGSMAAATIVGAPMLVNLGCTCPDAEWQDIHTLPRSTIESLRMEAEENDGRIPRESCLSYCADIGAFKSCSVRSDEELICFFDGEMPCDIGRRPQGLCDEPARGMSRLASLLAEMARLEAAAVIEFERVGDELASLGASANLLDWVARAADDERRHANVMRRLAESAGGHVPNVSVESRARRDAMALAVDNLREGVVGEMFGAVEARLAAKRASTKRLRRVFAGIAPDEGEHAALSLSIHRFLVKRLTSSDRDALSAEYASARDALARRSLGFDDSARQALGLPGATEGRAMVQRMDKETASRLAS